MSRPPAPHGNYSRYKNGGCRCAPCRSAWTEWYRDYRARRRDRDPNFDARRNEKQRAYYRRQQEAQP